MTRILQIFTDFILFYLYLCRSVLICVIRVPLNLEPRTLNPKPIIQGLFAQLWQPLVANIAKTKGLYFQHKPLILLGGDEGI
jgi:hypothetical protein